MSANCDRRKELEDFDNTKLGVKGLVDSGLTRIPRIFQHPPETLFYQQQAVLDNDQKIIPVIDMSNSRQDVVQSIRDAASTSGFFQVINHGVSVSLLDRLLDVVKAFFELPPEEKALHYKRDFVNRGVSFCSNYDLFNSNAASWRDTLQIQLAPVSVDPSFIPDVCRDEVMDWGREVKNLTERIMGMLSEGLGLSPDKLEDLSCMKRANMAAHYYPYCPEPNKTVGIASHTDPGVMTVLLQDQIGGLQVKYNGEWTNLKPVHGALVVNIGDLLQIISNDGYKSGEHRVFANPSHTPRVSIPVFFNPVMSDDLYGPLPELVTSVKPALYQEFKVSDFMTRFLTRGLDGKAMTSYFRL